MKFCMDRPFRLERETKVNVLKRGFRIPPPALGTVISRGFQSLLLKPLNGLWIVRRRGTDSVF